MQRVGIFVYLIELWKKYALYSMGKYENSIKKLKINTKKEKSVRNKK